MRKKARRLAVEVEIEPLAEENGEGGRGIIGRCSRCGDTARCASATPAARSRLCRLLRANCPRGEKNWYFPTKEVDRA
jgi:hypothetical protein